MTCLFEHAYVDGSLVLADPLCLMRILKSHFLQLHHTCLGLFLVVLDYGKCLLLREGFGSCCEQ